MWIFDRGQERPPDYDFIAFPVPGLMPVEFFKRDYPWSITLNPEKYLPPDDKVTVKLYAADESGHKVGAALPLNHSGVDRTPIGWVPNCIVFRPDRNAVAVGKRYLVEVNGVPRAKGEESRPIRYVVEFAAVLYDRPDQIGSGHKQP